MHLIKAMKEHYEVEEGWKQRQYVDITIDWDYKKVKYTFLCQSRWNEPLQDSDTLSQTSPSTGHTNIRSPRTEPQYSMQSPKTRQYTYPPLRRNSSKK